MKRSLFFLPIFLWSAFGGTANVLAEGNPLFVDNLPEKTRQEIQQMQTDPLPDLKTGENVSFWGLNTLNERQASPFTGQKGVGDWIQTPFGKFHLLSCWAGTKQADRYPFVIDGLIEKDIQIVEPTLTLVHGQNIADIQFFVPKIRPFQSSKPLSFRRALTFPFVADIKQKQKNLALTVLLRANACRGEKCTPFSQEFSLTLKGDEDWPTSFCSLIQYHLMFVPQTVGDDKIKVNQTDENNLLLGVRSDDTFSPKNILIRDDANKAFALKSQQKRGEFRVLALSFDEKIRFPLTVTVDTHNEVWERRIEAADKAFDLPPLSKDSPPLGRRLLLFWLLSPLTVYLLCLSFKNDFESRRRSLLILAELIVGWLIVCGFYLFYPVKISWLWYNPVWLIFVLGVFVCFWRSRHAGHALILTALFPWYFLEAIYHANRWTCLLWTGLLSIVPYVLFALFPHIGTCCSRLFGQIPTALKKVPLWIDICLLIGMIILLVR